MFAEEQLGDWHMHKSKHSGKRGYRGGEPSKHLGKRGYRGGEPKGLWENAVGAPDLAISEGENSLHLRDSISND